MLTGMMQFFLGEMERPGLWRYWDEKNIDHNTIPPDLDDIACISACVASNTALIFPQI